MNQGIKEFVYVAVCFFVIFIEQSAVEVDADSSDSSYSTWALVLPQVQLANDFHRR